jgi:hypothetical protein
MTTATLTVGRQLPEPAKAAPRPGSRAARMAHPLMLQAIRQVAADHGVCIRPQTMRWTNLATGETHVIDLPCNATYEKKCPPCAAKKKKLRQAQMREGWHRTDEPDATPRLPSEDQEALIRTRAHLEAAKAECEMRGDWPGVAECQEAIAELEELMTLSGLRGTPPGKKTDKDGEDLTGGPQRKRSTRRRQDVPDLPRRKVVAKTIGRAFATRNGKTYRPSTFLTLTLDSYGRVRDDGSPVDHSTYDYRRAAWDAVHFPALLDRFWQNLRRAEGWNVQYMGSIEPQRRLAPHAHFAIRGTMAHKTLRQVVAATYHQVWWPSTATIVYHPGDSQPVWDDQAKTYRDPTTDTPLPTWAEAMADLDDELDTDPDRQPEHVVRFGVQVKADGVLAGTDDAEKMIYYLSKYITKSVADCHTITTPAAEAHQLRLWEELRYTPCSERCPNWLRYGIQPDKARAKQPAGACKAKVHQSDTLGIGGRRVLVSRDWTGKTLADHRYDQLAWVRKVLRRGLLATNPAGVGDEDQADTDNEDGERDGVGQLVDAARRHEAPDPIIWERARPDDPDVPNLGRRLLRMISTRIQQRATLAAARVADPPGDVSATGPARVQNGVDE